jgi:hypothetical protein
MSNQRLPAAQTESHRFWQAHIKAFATSGFSRSEYCRRHNLSYHAMTYWLRKQPSVKKQASVTLIEVPMPLSVTDTPSSTPLRLRIGSEYMIEIGTNFDEVSLTKVIAVLEQCR